MPNNQMNVRAAKNQTASGRGRRDLPAGLLVRWFGVSAVSVLNIGVLTTFWVAHLKRPLDQRHDPYRAERRQLALSTLFVLGCAFRSFLPRADTQRIALVDSPLSSILVGRTVATAAELSFVGQWMTLLETFARPARLEGILTFSKLLFPAILGAEIFSWLGVLTTNNLWHFLEESIWGLCEVGLTLSALALRRQYHGPTRRFMGWMAVCGAIYVAYMFTFDIPMYWRRWRSDRALGKRSTGFRQGLRNLVFQWTITRKLEDWEGEFVWMTIYFSLAVWLSLAFTQAPDASDVNRLSPA